MNLPTNNIIIYEKKKQENFILTGNVLNSNLFE